MFFVRWIGRAIVQNRPTPIGNKRETHEPGMKKPTADERQRAFILRCWREESGGGWRFNLEPIGQEGQRAGFENLFDLVSFLDLILDGQVDNRP